MITCREMSQLLTDYLDGAMDPFQRLKIKFHIFVCPNCRVHIKKMKQLVLSMGYIPEDTPVPEEFVARLRSMLT